MRKLVGCAGVVGLRAVHPAGRVLTINARYYRPDEEQTFSRDGCIGYLTVHNDSRPALPSCSPKRGRQEPILFGPKAKPWVVCPDRTLKSFGGKRLDTQGQETVGLGASGELLLRGEWGLAVSGPGRLLTRVTGLPADACIACPLAVKVIEAGFLLAVPHGGKTRMRYSLFEIRSDGSTLRRARYGQAPRSVKSWSRRTIALDARRDLYEVREDAQQYAVLRYPANGRSAKMVLNQKHASKIFGERRRPNLIAVLGSNSVGEYRSVPSKQALRWTTEDGSAAERSAVRPAEVPR